MILITGATGFVGRTVSLAVKKSFPNEKILCLGWINDDEVNLKNKLQLEKKGLKVELVDLVTKKGFSKIPKTPDVVIHLAANVNTADANHQVNDIGTRNLISHLNLSKKSYFIYTSTTVHTIGGRNVSLGMNESTVPVPTNEYGRTKLRAEKILINKCLKSKFSLTVLRLNTVYGPDPRPNSMFLQLPEMINANSLFTRLNWPGKTALVHVEDVSYVIVNTIKKLRPQPGSYNLFIVFSQNVTLAQISRSIHKTLKKEYKPIVLPIFVWKIASYSKIFIPYFENFTSPKFYSNFWRLSLIVDDVIYCKSSKLENELPNWKKKRL